MLIFVGSLLWWQQDAAGGNKNGEAQEKLPKKVGIPYFSFWKFHEYIKEQQPSKFKFDLRMKN